MGGGGGGWPKEIPICPTPAGIYLYYFTLFFTHFPLNVRLMDILINLYYFHSFVILCHLFSIIQCSSVLITMCPPFLLFITNVMGTTPPFWVLCIYGLM